MSHYLILFLFSIPLVMYTDHYIKHFMTNLKREVFDNFQEVFPLYTPNINAQQKLDCSRFQSKEFCSIYWLFLLFIGALESFYYYFHSLEIAIWFGLFFTCTVIIFIIDYSYQLIPINFCQLLFSCILIGDYFNFLPFTIEQSLFNGGLGFLCFYCLYYFSKWFYKKEAIGRGDYWLVLALTMIVPPFQLSLFVFIACLLALFYVFFLRWQGNYNYYISFGPFLILSAYLFLFYYLLGY